MGKKDKKIKVFLKKSWKIIIGIITAIGSIIIFQNIRQKRQEKQEKKKKELIKENRKKLKYVREKEKAHEKIINGSRSKYNNIISGK